MFIFCHFYTIVLETHQVKSFSNETNLLVFKLFFSNILSLVGKLAKVF